MFKMPHCHNKRANFTVNIKFVKGQSHLTLRGKSPKIPYEISEKSSPKTLGTLTARVRKFEYADNQTSEFTCTVKL